MKQKSLELIGKCCKCNTFKNPETQTFEKEYSPIGVEKAYSNKNLEN
jgi:hypothetical protein